MNDRLKDHNLDPRLDPTRVIRAPRGNTLTCKSWLTEAAYRMIQNNLDAEVAEHPTSLVVYGGIGRAARNWACYDQILATLKTLNDDETLLIQSGKPVGVFRTHVDARLLAFDIERARASKRRSERLRAAHAAEARSQNPFADEAAVVMLATHLDERLVRALHDALRTDVDP